MEFESIKKIVEAEKQAEEKKQEAKEKAKMILNQAENSKKNNLDYFKRELDTKEKDLREEKLAEVSKARAKIEAETSKGISDLQTVIKDKVPEAVEIIFDKVIKI